MLLYCCFIFILFPHDFKLAFDAFIIKNWMPNVLLPTYNANITLHYTSCSDQKRLSRYACRQHSVITPRAQIMSSQHHRPEEVNMLFAMGIKQVKQTYCSSKKYVLTLCSSEHPLHYNTTHLLPHLLMD